jgi:ABC-type transporter Mla subunit MlaD
MEGRHLDNLSFGSSQTGDVSAGDIASGDVIKTVAHVYNVTTSLEQVTTMLREDLQQFESRLNTLEIVERQHASERQSLTRLITFLATESKTVSDVQRLLEKQINSESAERSQRRHYLDSMLLLLVILTVINMSLHIYRVFRRPGRTA